MSLHKRFTQIFDSLTKNDLETALTLIFPLIDGAGKRIYGLNKNGERFRKVVDDNRDFLYWFISNGALHLTEKGELLFTINNKKHRLASALYTLSRNGLLHEGTSSDTIKFEGNKIGTNKLGQLCFPSSLVWGLALMLSYLECYKNSCPKNYVLSFNQEIIRTDTFWGSKEKITLLVSKGFEETRSANKKNQVDA
jgi:hypothetical protein